MAEKETPEIVDNTELQIDEASAADTLKPGAGSGGTESKAETLATFTQLLAQLGKEDLSKLFNDVQSQFGPNKAPGAEDKSDANRATVAMKPSAAVGKGAWKEDIDEIFGTDDLTEDFKEKASTVFEAAVEARCILEETRLQEQYETLAAELEEEFEQKLEETSTAMFEELSTKLDQYLDYVVEQWMEANEVAIETQLRAEIAEGFMAGLQNLFAEHYITVPEDKLDVFAEMKAELDATKAKLNESIDEKLALQSVIDEATKEALLDEVSEGLAVTQSEKLRTLAEGLEYTDAETFKKKLEIVKENYFTEKKLSVATGLITEEIDGTDEAVNESVLPASMSKYVETISKSIK
jgi:hypothetical protein